MKAPPILMRWTWLRRAITIPAVVVLALWLWGLFPVWLVVAAFASRFVPGRWRILRLLWFFVVYLALELVVLGALLVLWVRAGFGRTIRGEASQRRHYALMGWFLDRLVATARRTFNLTFHYDEDIVTSASTAARGDAGDASEDRPRLVFCRHAGPGDSLLLIDGVLNRAHRRPRIVLKDFIQFEPAIDVILNRVPTEFVPSARHGGEVVARAIARLAGSAGPQDSFVLFPEGGNVTDRRRDAAVAKLRSIGRDDLAARAEALDHLLPPKPLGALAAIEAAPEAEVVFVGHHGLERLSGLGDLWRGLPMDFTVRVRTWRVAPTDVPPAGEREDWLYARWEALDAWIGDCFAVEAAAQGEADGSPPQAGGAPDRRGAAS